MLVKTKKYRYTIGLLIASFIFLMIFEVLPRILSVAELGYSLYTQQIDLTEAGSNANLEIKLRTENHRLKSEIKQKVLDNKQNQTLSSIISCLDEISLESNADISSIKPGNQYQKENLWIMPLEIHINADYEGIYNFLRFAESSDKIILFKQIVIKSIEPGAENLNINAEVEVYLNL